MNAASAQIDVINQIYEDPDFQRAMEDIRLKEVDRPFCGHGLSHLLDTARLAWIENLERSLGFSRELIYAAALLHDIGRAKEGEADHHLESARMAEPILRRTNLSGEEIKEILTAVSSHRDRSVLSSDSLAGLLYRADKSSRLCLDCPAAPECRWPAPKRNLTLSR